MAGSFHIAPGSSFSIRQFHIHDFQIADVKLSHTINHLSFGDKIEFATTHPLDGFKVEPEGGKYYKKCQIFLIRYIAFMMFFKCLKKKSFKILNLIFNNRIRKIVIKKYVLL